MELTPNFDIPIPSDPMNQRQVRAEALAIDVVLFDLEGDIAALPDGSGTTNKLTFWSDGDTLDDTTIHYSGGKLGFGGVTSPGAWIDVLPATTETVLRASRSTGYFIGFSFLQNQDALCGPFEWLVNSGVNPGGLRRDTYCQFGYNPQGTTDDLRLYWAIETRWNPGGTQVQDEVYLECISPSNGGGAVSVRPLAWTIREDVQSVQTDMFTSAFNIFDWPGNPGADHPYADFTYPSLRIAEGNLLINPDSRTSVDNENIIKIRGLNAIGINSGALIQVGDASATGIQIHGDVGINTDGPNSVARLFLQSSAVGQQALRIIPTYAGTQTAAFIAIQSEDGSNLWQFSASGQLVSGPGASGGALDVGLLRSGTNKWKVTNASSGYGSMEMDSLTATGFLEAATGVLPVTNDGAALGSTTKQWSDLFLAEGGVINWDNGDITITQTGNVLTFAGAATRYEFDASLTPVSSDGSALGSTALMFSDLFLASGGVINFNNGDLTLTHAANLLSIAGGDLAHAENIRMNAASAQAWTNGKAMYGPNSGFLFGDAGDFHMTSNCMVDSTAAHGWRYVTTGPAVDLYLYNGNCVVRKIGSGSAGADLDWASGSSVTLI